MMISLWPEDAPLSAGHSIEDTPSPRLTSYILKNKEETPAVIILPGGGNGR
ncbi:hypothetical protein [Jeotgalibacillus soli]|uniref:Alpha/beta hydrolase n=1 Tax=Jeotgalibacillus soli TaxID=889306 RepID=A0A0C2RUJ8_9BACL|nr:hypothetical protein [Jeotgalibacillus soli]KIL45419.1 hypothetical protein KP78_29630 [Jeotgalibacillus soli]